MDCLCIAALAPSWPGLEGPTFSSLWPKFSPSDSQERKSDWLHSANRLCPGSATHLGPVSCGQAETGQALWVTAAEGRSREEGLWAELGRHVSQCLSLPLSPFTLWASMHLSSLSLWLCELASTLPRGISFSLLRCLGTGFYHNNDTSLHNLLFTQLVLAHVHQAQNSYL